MPAASAPRPRPRPPRPPRLPARPPRPPPEACCGAVPPCHTAASSGSTVLPDSVSSCAQHLATRAAITSRSQASGFCFRWKEGRVRRSTVAMCGCVQACTALLPTLFAHPQLVTLSAVQHTGLPAGAPPPSPRSAPRCRHPQAPPTGRGAEGQHCRRVHKVAHAQSHTIIREHGALAMTKLLLSRVLPREGQRSAAVSKQGLTLA